MRDHVVARVAALLLILAPSSCSKGGGSTPTDPGGGGGGNHNPTANLNIDNVHLAYGGTALVSVIASDSDGDQLTFSWTATLGSVSTSGPSATTATFTAGSQWGPATVTVTVSDGKGGSAQATALTYIRNPNPPYIGLSPVAPSSSSCSGFALEVTPNEDLLVTNLYMWPNISSTSCHQTRDFATPINLTAGQPYAFRDPGCIPSSCSGTSILDYEVTIRGRRPEPDGGTFIFTCDQWSPSHPLICH